MLTLFHQPFCPHSRYRAPDPRRVRHHRSAGRGALLGTAGRIFAAQPGGGATGAGCRGRTAGSRRRDHRRIHRGNPSRPEMPRIACCRREPGRRVEVRRLAHWFNDKFYAEVSGPLVIERVLQAPYDSANKAAGRPIPRRMRAARHQYPLSSRLYRLAGADARLAGRQPVDLCRSCRGCASVSRRLSGRSAVERRRSGKELVRAGEVPSLVPADPGRHAGRPSAVENLRRPRFLKDPLAIKATLAERARALGFDAFGVARPDAAPESKSRLARFLAEGAHGDMAWMETTAERRGDPRWCCGPTRAQSSCSG